MESPNKSYLKLLINDPNTNMPDPQSNAYILQVKNLPTNMTNLTLYNLFRPFGPLFSCRNQLKGGTALVQFFKPEDAQSAMSSLVNAYYVFFIIYYKFLH